MMKAYKIDLSMLEGEAREDVSTAIQRHAFRLGYKWRSFGKEETKYEFCPVLYFEKDGAILKDECADGFKTWSNTEISITDFLALKPEDVKDAPEFKPFDRVFVRDSDDETWAIDFFESFSEDAPFSFQCLGSCWKQCIPYEGNEHLLDKTEAAVCIGIIPIFFNPQKEEEDVK